MSLKYLKPITWDEAFSLWEKSEAELPHWIEHYKKRGFNSWREWRTNSFKPIGPEQLSWDLYEVIEPLKTIPEFYAGPFRSWLTKFYNDSKILKFKELAKKIEIQNDSHIGEIIKNFPEESVLIGLTYESNTVVIDGLHRCCALAIANENNININCKIFIICAKFSGELPILGQFNSPT